MNSFGRLFRVSIFGESHGPGTGIVIDGCPPGIPLDVTDFADDLSRRKSGAYGTTARHEPDLPEVLSGLYNGFTTGSPIMLITRNSDKRPADYDDFRYIPRPGHADFTAGFKYSGFSDLRGGGHFSGRITWGIVVAGVVARKIIEPAVVEAKIISAGGSLNIEEAIRKAVEGNDTVGGVIECTIANPQKGLGEPFFYSVESAVSQIVMSIPAIRGIEFGSGFAAAGMKGSEHNDPFIDKDGKTLSNNAGGVNGGISNGNEIVFRVAVKPASSTGVEQTTFDFREEKMVSLKIRGRHDACIALRVPVILEAAAAVAMADLLLINRGIHGSQIS